jgi:hypothetical protein
VDTGVGGSAARADDDDDGSAPRGGVDTGMGGTAGKGAVEDSTALTGGGADDSRSVPVVPLSLAGAALLGAGAYWVRRTLFAGS